MFKKPIIMLGLLTSSLLLTGCANPLVSIDNGIRHAITAGSSTTDDNDDNYSNYADNDNDVANYNPESTSSTSSDQSLSSSSSTVNKQTSSHIQKTAPSHTRTAPIHRSYILKLFINATKQKFIDYHRIHQIVQYYQTHHRKSDLITFDQNYVSLLQQIATIREHQHLIQTPFNNRDLAILYANANWMSFIDDYRNQPRQLLYTRLVHGIDLQRSIDTNNNNNNQTLRFTPNITRVAIHHIFKIFPQQPSKYQLKIKVDPLNGNEEDITPALNKQILQTYIQNNQQFNSPMQKNTRKFLTKYNQAIKEEQRLNVGTANHPDDNANRAIDIINGYIVKYGMTIDMTNLDIDDTYKNSIHQLLTTKYHFTEQVIQTITQFKSPVSDAAFSIDGLYDNERYFNQLN